MADFNNVPGGAELWKIDGRSYLKYEIPGSRSTIPMLYKITSGKDVKALVGPGQPIRYSKTMTWDRARKMGALQLGHIDELRNTAEHPFRVLMANISREAMTRPWLKDPEVLAVVGSALLKGRTVTEEDLKTTKWWRTKNKSQREWLVLRESDPSTARNKQWENRRMVERLFTDLGGHKLGATARNWLGDQLTAGNWRADEVQKQMKWLVDPTQQHRVHSKLRRLAKNIDTTQEHEQTVRDAVNEWLGPANSWNTKQVQNWASLLRRSPDAEDRLVKTLQKQFDGLFPGYRGQELKYEDVASSWRGFFSSIWGEQPDETSDTWLQVLRNNDSHESRKLLYNEGLRQNNRTVTNDMLSKMGEAFGGGVSERAV